MNGDSRQDATFPERDDMQASAPHLVPAALLFGLVALLFWVSGFSSLIYQVVWTRMLVFVFGSTTFATSTVLAVFMGGLALGSFLAAVVADRIKRPFLWYGVLEGVIGVWALLAPWLFDLAIPLYKVIWQFNHLSVIPFSLLRFLVATIILLLPTTCMGATLPLLSRFVTDSLNRVGNRVGTLYAVNTFGAVGGAAAAGFYLLPAFGLFVTTCIAAALNLALCALVVCLSLRWLKTETSIWRSSCPEQSRLGESGRLPPAVAAVMVAFSVSGAIAMIYEVGWTRTLLMVIGSTTYAFTVMLATFLIGIFIGSLVISKFVDSFKDPLAWLASIQLLLSLSALLSINVFNYVPYWNILINLSFLNDPSAALVVRFLLSAMVFLPITLCLGAIFPVVVKVCARDLSEVGRSVGTLYSANTLGAIVGAFLAGFCVVPMFGAEKTLILASVVNLILGVCLLFFVDSIGKTIKVVALAGCLPVIFWASANPKIWDELTLMSAQWQRRSYLAQPVPVSQFPPYEHWRALLHRDSHLDFWRDGACATVGVVGYGDGVLSLLTNGHVDATNQVDMANQILIAAYPLAVKPKAEDVAVVGWGSGVTVGVAGLSKANVTAIEIEPAVIDAGKLFRAVNLEPEKNRRVHLEVNDGRNYLLATDKKFDLIISEPSNPWQAGVCNLFTREYFACCKDRLKPGGIFTLWVQFSEVSTENLLRVLAALKSVYAYTLPVLTDQGNLAVLSSDRPFALDFAQVKNNVESGLLSRQFKRSSINNSEELLARIVSCPEAVGKLTDSVLPNSDDRNRLEFEVAKTYESAYFHKQNHDFLDESCNSPWQAVDWGGMDARSQAAVMCRVAAACLDLKYPRRALSWAKESYRLHKNPDALHVCALVALAQGDEEAAFLRFTQALQIEPSHVPTILTRGLVALEKGDVIAARKDFLQVLAIDPALDLARLAMARSYYRQLMSHGFAGARGKARQAGFEILKWLKDLPCDREFAREHHDELLLAGLAAEATGDSEKAEGCLRAYLSWEPEDILALRSLGTLLFQKNKLVESARLWQQSFAAGRQEQPAIMRKARAYLKEGKDDRAAFELAKALQAFPADQEPVLELKRLSSKNTVARQIMRDCQLND